MSDIQVTTVPKDLYYHEVAYVRGLEKSNAELVEALETIARQPITGEDASFTHTVSFDRLVRIARAALAAARQGEPK